MVDEVSKNFEQKAGREKKNQMLKLSTVSVR